MLEQNNMRHIIYNLFAVALLLALPIAINAQTTKNDTTTIPKWAKTFPASLTLEDIKKLAEESPDAHDRALPFVLTLSGRIPFLHKTAPTRTTSDTRDAQRD